ncbi:DcaP family trimeric outer membrane transporter [Halomonas vilamensis]|uniref:DcaP family trimeric outer membrane transporter n=1 Tax=Vreelandella vilamensis TaxID=531309 RepID=A0ABU1H7G4_9GAMM|nr:DcaP family trimeric outer membrane transporter [Halomonas vilamensis]MDR5899622.1 DcaP family trimeric outer membrane transporter [Halomonas vilamensis]
MTIQKTFKKASIFSASALALAVASASHAVDFEVGDTTASVYGYAKLDMIHDVDADMGNTVAHSAIRVDGQDGSDGHTDFHAKQSRIGFKTSTPMNGSTLNTTIEGDFYGSGNDTLRLRHAFGEWNGVLAGQTWTNFGGFIGTTPTVDFLGQVGQGNIGRQSQLRYTTGGFSVALEDPGTIGSNVDMDNRLNVNDSVKSSFPDLTLRYHAGADNINYGASAVMRQIEYYNSTQDSDESAFAWGLNLEASVEVAEGIKFQGSLTHGDGLGGYMYGSPARAGYIDNSGDVEGIEGTGGTFGMSAAAGPGKVNLAYGVATADLDDAVDEGAIGSASLDKVESIYLNYIWSPADRISYGVEAGYHTKDTQGGDDGDAVRIHGMAMYSF